MQNSLACAVTKVQSFLFLKSLHLWLKSKERIH